MHPEINDSRFYNFLMYYNRKNVFKRLDAMIDMGFEVCPYGSTSGPTPLRSVKDPTMLDSNARSLRRDIQSYADLFKGRVQRAGGADDTFIDWLYAGNPVGHAFGLNAWSDGELAAHYAASPSST